MILIDPCFVIIWIISCVSCIYVCQRPYYVLFTIQTYSTNPQRYTFMLQNTPSSVKLFNKMSTNFSSRCRHRPWATTTNIRPNQIYVCSPEHMYNYITEYCIYPGSCLWGLTLKLFYIGRCDVQTLQTHTN